MFCESIGTIKIMKHTRSKMKGYWITQRITNSMNFGTQSTFAYLIYKMPEKY
jgi:hypothetical protein